MQMARSMLQTRRERAGRSTGTGGLTTAEGVDPNSQSTLVEEIKRQLQSEMGLLPIRVLRERRKSFVEINSYDKSGSLRYSTAGYLGHGHFITVKHGVMALTDADPERRITSVKVLYNGKKLAATVVDSGTANAEVHPGDWAIIKVREEIDLPPLEIDTKYGYEFAEPIFRLGNDYSKGIILSTGYVGQRMDDGLVTCLTDGHPGSQAAACSIRRAASSGFRSAGWKPTIAFPSSCRCVKRCSARCPLSEPRRANLCQPTEHIV